MSSYPPSEKCSIAKKLCWEMYSHKPWFYGCGINTDEEEAVVEIRQDPNSWERFTVMSEYDGVRIVVVPWSLEKHGERYVPA